eukprot:3524781-Prymnesium_polylepis.2
MANALPRTSPSGGWHFTHKFHPLLKHGARCRALQHQVVDDERRHRRRVAERAGDRLVDEEAHACVQRDVDERVAVDGAEPRVEKGSARFTQGAEQLHAPGGEHRGDLAVVVGHVDAQHVQAECEHPGRRRSDIDGRRSGVVHRVLGRDGDGRVVELDGRELVVDGDGELKLGALEIRFAADGEDRNKGLSETLERDLWPNPLCKGRRVPALLVLAE